MKQYSHYVLFGLCVMLFSCSDKKEAPKPIEKKDTTAAIVEAPKPVARQYRSYYLGGSKSLTELISSLSEQQKIILFKINRRDLRHFKEGDSIVVPAGSDNELEYSPFPMQLPFDSATKKILFIDQRIQAFAAYQQGRLLKWGPTSTGKKTTPTPPGLYHTNWKSKETHSTVNGEWILKWYFNLDNLQGVSLHEYELPGYPASHSCVRLLSDDAYWIYQWADQWKLSADRKTVDTTGTPVIVYNTYGYGKRSPWKELVSNPMATVITDSVLISQTKRYLHAE